MDAMRRAFCCLAAGSLLVLTWSSALALDCEGPSAAAGTLEGCRGKGVTLLFQDRPVEGPRHQSADLFLHALSDMDIAVGPDGRGSVRLEAGIVSDLDGSRGGVQGWTIQAGGPECIEVTEATTEGTAADVVPEGVRLPTSFERTEVPNWRGEPGFVSAVVLALLEDVSLVPRGTATVLSFTVEAEVPSGENLIVAELGWVDGCLCTGWPVENNVTVGGESERHCEVPVTLRFTRSVGFRRGDANADARVDLSDAISIFRYLFSGGRRPGCLDTADTDDDGRVTLADGVRILLDFFRPGTAISSPGPFDCGVDPTADALDCAIYGGCGAGG